MGWEEWRLAGGGLGETEGGKIIHRIPGGDNDFRFYLTRKPLKSFVWERNIVGVNSEKKSFWLVGVEWLIESGVLSQCFRCGKTKAYSRFKW